MFSQFVKYVVVWGGIHYGMCLNKFGHYAEKWRTTVQTYLCAFLVSNYLHSPINIRNLCDLWIYIKLEDKESDMHRIKKTLFTFEKTIVYSSSAQLHKHVDLCSTGVSNMWPLHWSCFNYRMWPASMFNNLFIFLFYFVSSLLTGQRNYKRFAVPHLRYV